MLFLLLSTQALLEAEEVPDGRLGPAASLSAGDLLSCQQCQVEEQACNAASWPDTDPADGTQVTGGSGLREARGRGGGLAAAALSSTAAAAAAASKSPPPSSPPISPRPPPPSPPQPPLLLYSELSPPSLFSFAAARRPRPSQRSTSPEGTKPRSAVTVVRSDACQCTDAALCRRRRRRRAPLCRAANAAA